MIILRKWRLPWITGGHGGRLNDPQVSLSEGDLTAQNRRRGLWGQSPRLGWKEEAASRSCRGVGTGLPAASGRGGPAGICTQAPETDSALPASRTVRTSRAVSGTRFVVTGSSSRRN